jgi:hypothetical protein
MNLRTIALILPISLLLAGCEPDDGTPADTDGSGDTTAGDGDGEAGDGDGDGGDGDGDGGDGDGDAGDGDGDGGDGDGDGDDPLQAAACEALVSGTPEPLVAALSAGDAATAPVVADGMTSYIVTLPMDAAGFIQLEIPDWETTQAFFTVQDIDYTITTMANAQTPGPRDPVPACGELGITDQRVFFPHWTPATIEFGATGPREIPLMIIRQ